MGNTTRKPTVVLDTNVLVAAIRSRRGASFRLLSLVGTGAFEIALSVPLVLEYEYAMHRAAAEIGLPASDVDDILDYLCMVGRHQDIYFLWRPMLRDPHDDMVLELGVASSADVVVTFNRRDFEGADRFDLEIRTPAEFLHSEGLT
jgi:putative PIN family toxin of toxin-antitoxin system